MSADWLTATGMLLSGAIVGFMFFYVASRKQSAASVPQASRIDLEAKRDVLIVQLRELEDTGGTAEERARLEGEAAEVLRELDAAGAPALAMPSREKSGGAAAALQKDRSGLKGFVWGAGSAAAIALLITFVMTSAKPKEPMQQAAPMQSAGAQSQQSDPQLRTLEVAVQAQPDNVSLRNDLAKAYIDRENLVRAFEEASAVLQRAPGDARALTYQAIVRLAMGEAEPASKQLEIATKNDPQLVDAWVALAWSYIQIGKVSDADNAIESAVKQHPEDETRFREVLGKMKAQLAATPASTRNVATAPSAPAGSGGGVHITLALAAGVTAPPSGVIYVVVRDAQAGGPPSAVKRIGLGAFPMDVELTSADSMMGQPLPASMRIEARIDTDGNAMTRESGAPSASKDGVGAGEKITLTLQ